MSEIPSSINVAGARVAGYPAPVWVKLLKAAIYVLLFTLVVLTALLFDEWQWLVDGITSEFAFKTAAIVTLASALVGSLVFTRGLDKLMGLKRDPAKKLIFNGRREIWRVALSLVIFASLLSANIYSLRSAINTCPLPAKLGKLRITVNPPGSSNEKLMPIYFWDYATWFDPDWLTQYNLVLPYEKGPPQKLLSKVFFENAQTNSIELELHGRRPRSYAPNEVHAIFSEAILQPRDWPLAWRLEREAGLISSKLEAGGTTVPALYLFRLDQGSSNTTQGIGVPWTIGRARAFFWGPEGSVFQLKCNDPCRFTRLLELVQFPADPRGSHGERLEWTTTYLKKLIMEQPISPDLSKEEKTRRENILSIYLISLLTQDPRDPEAFFHIGKLAKNRETVLSAIHYGRDLGLEAAKVAELEAVAEQMSR